MQPSKSRYVRAAFALTATSLLVAAGPAAAVAANTANGSVYTGAPVAIGKGTARTVVHTDADGKPLSVAVEMTGGVLQGLPTKLNKKTAEGEWEFALSMPPTGPKTGYTEVVVDWNPHGHPPPHVYTVPHFDFHFYGIPASDVEQVMFTGPGDAKAKVTDAELIPPDYQVIADTAVNKMGVHAIDTMAPEFHGTPFTATFIYGYYAGRLIFVEPMVTQAFLQTKPAFSGTVKTPGKYSVKGYYPTKYAVRYDAARKSYVVELDGLKYWPGAVGGLHG